MESSNRSFPLKLELEHECRYMVIFIPQCRQSTKEYDKDDKGDQKHKNDYFQHEIHFVIYGPFESCRATNPRPILSKGSPHDHLAELAVINQNNW